MNEAQIVEFPLHPSSGFHFEEGGVADLEALKPLFQAEFDEVGEKDALTLDINFAMLEALINFGRAVLCLLKEGDTVMGYSVWTVSPHPKYQSTLWAFNSGFWIVPEARKPNVAKRLIEFAEIALRQRGCQFIQAGGRIDHPAAIRLYEALGYKPYEIALYKQI